MQSKDAIRQRMLARRESVTFAERRQIGTLIARKVFEPPVNLMLYLRRVCIYLSTGDEIPTRYIARRAWEAQRLVCVPAWSRSAGAYRLYALDPHTPLITGHHQIREPAVREPVDFHDVEAFIVPGLAFDQRGGRLGYGAGHYDTMLALGYSKALKIALCYEWQLSETPLPQTPSDIPMDWIITEKRTIDCRAGR